MNDAMGLDSAASSMSFILWDAERPYSLFRSLACELSFSGAGESSLAVEEQGGMSMSSFASWNDVIESRLGEGVASIVDFASGEGRALPL